MSKLTEEQIHEYNEAVLNRIRQLAVRRGTSITKIEKALNYGNGTVSGWTKAKKKAPHERVEAIARYLEVPTVALTGEPGNYSEDGSPVSDEDIKYALFGRCDESVNEMYEQVKKYAAFLMQHEIEENSK